MKNPIEYLKERPLGINILTLFCLVCAIISFYSISELFIYKFNNVLKVTSIFQFIMAISMLALSGILFLLMSKGLWQGEEWARALMFYLTLFSAPMSLMSIYALSLSPDPSIIEMIKQMLFIVIDFNVIIYLNSARIKFLFNENHNRVKENNSDPNFFILKN